VDEAGEGEEAGIPCSILVQMNYPKEFYVTTPIVGDKVWLDFGNFSDGRKAYHGPWWIVLTNVVGTNVVKIKQTAGVVAFVRPDQLLRMSKSQIKKMAVLPAKPA